MDRKRSHQRSKSSLSPMISNLCHQLSRCIYHVFLIIRRHHHVRSLWETNNIWILGKPDTTKQQLILGINQVWSVDLRLHPTLKHVVPVTYGLLGGRLAARNLSFDICFRKKSWFQQWNPINSQDWRYSKKKLFPPMGKWAEDKWVCNTYMHPGCLVNITS